MIRSCRYHEGACITGFRRLPRWPAGTATCRTRGVKKNHGVSSMFGAFIGETYHFFHISCNGYSRLSTIRTVALEIWSGTAATADVESSCMGLCHSRTAGSRVEVQSEQQNCADSARGRGLDKRRYCKCARHRVFSSLSNQMVNGGKFIVCCDQDTPCISIWASC